MDVKNILVPVDFSKCSKNALRVAIGISKKVNAKIHMVNAVHVHTPHPDFSGGVVIEGIIADYEAQVKQSFDELESEMIELQDVPHEADRFLSYLTDAIRAEAETKDIDLIIMGTRSDHDKLEHMVGTHATDVIQVSDVPILIIPENVDDFHPKKLGFASDFLKELYQGQLEIIRWIAKLYDLEIIVFHVADGSSGISKEDEKNIGDILSRLEGFRTSVQTSTAEKVIDGIQDFVQVHQLDVLAMMPRRHNLFERIFKRSVTRSVAIDVEVPLLTFHEM